MAKSIYQFPTTRDYLRASFEAAKVSTTSLSVELYADRVGLGRSLFKMILSGKRNLTLASALQIAKSQKLSASETDYLQALVLRERSKVKAEQTFYTKKTKSLKKNARVSSVPVTAKALLGDPYILPILVYLTDFTAASASASHLEPSATEIQGIAAHFGIEIARVRSAVTKLKDLASAHEEKSKRQVHYVFSKLTQTFSQQAYLKSWLDESAKRIDADYQNPAALFQTSTISINEDKIPQMIGELKAVVDKYIGMETDRKKQTLVQANLQLFELLK